MVPTTISERPGNRSDFPPRPGAGPAYRRSGGVALAAAGRAPVEVAPRRHRPAPGVDRSGRHRSRPADVTAAPGRSWLLVVAVLLPLLLALAVATSGTARGPAQAAVATEAAGPESQPTAAAPADGNAAPVHVVHPGETLWTIARDLAPDGDVRSTVDRLVALNGTADLQVGQRLRLS
ncbi:MAG: LysM peptidoglycan-binding domain-containing protein [Acidimicrobiia bacterium]